jgi:hypothetical protein
MGQRTPFSLLTAVLLVVALFLQPLAVAWATPGTADIHDAVHTLLHLEDTGHHHHEDGSLHIDSSAESVDHVMADHLHSPTGLLSDNAWYWLIDLPQTRIFLAPAAWPPPVLDGLLRPPRQRI